MDKKLGRGLASLIGNETEIKRATVIHPGQNLQTGEKITELEIGNLQAGQFQPRGKFSEEELQELSDSIKEHGIISPIIVRKFGDKFEIIAGERRFRAAKLANLKKVPVIIKDIDDKKALEISIIENIQRQDLTSVEESRALQRLIDGFNYSHEELAQTLGKSRSHITNMLRLLKLPLEVQELLDKRLLTMGHARALINCPDDQTQLAHIAIKNNLSVRDLENIIKKRNKEESKTGEFKIEQNTEYKTSKNKEPEIIEIEEKLTSILNSEVEIDYNNNQGGKISIKFSNLNQLDSIIRKINKLPMLQVKNI